MAVRRDPDRDLTEVDRLSFVRRLSVEIVSDSGAERPETLNAWPRRRRRLEAEGVVAKLYWHDVKGAIGRQFQMAIRRSSPISHDCRSGPKRAEARRAGLLNQCSDGWPNRDISRR